LIYLKSNIYKQKKSKIIEVIQIKYQKKFFKNLKYIEIFYIVSTIKPII